MIDLRSPDTWALADHSDFVELYELPLWTSATIFCGTVGLMLGGLIGAELMGYFDFRM